MKTERYELANGLPVLVTPMPHASTVSVVVFARAGSRYETKEELGGAHLLEHLFFKGGQAFPNASAVWRAIERTGGAMNAGTGIDCASYFAKVGYTDAAVAVSILSDMLLHASFSAQDVERERKVVIQELRVAYDDPQDALFEDFKRLLFGKTSHLAHDPGGSIEGVSRLTRAHLLAMRARLYTADRMLVSITGNIEPQEALTMLAPLSGLPAGTAAAEDATVFYPRSQSRFSLRKEEGEQVYMLWGGVGPRAYTEQASILKVAVNIFAGGPSARLFQRIREQEALVYDVSGDVEEQDKSQSFWCVDTSTDPHSVSRLIHVFKEELHRFHREGVTAEELEDTKSAMWGRLLLALETSDSVAMIVGNEYLFSDTVFDLENVRIGLDKMQLNDVTNIIGQYFHPRRLRLAMCGMPFESRRELRRLFLAYTP